MAEFVVRLSEAAGAELLAAVAIAVRSGRLSEVIAEELAAEILVAIDAHAGWRGAGFEVMRGVALRLDGSVGD